MRKLVVALSIAAFAGACSPANPSKPAGGDENSVRAWVNENKLTRGGWMVAFTQKDAAFLIRPNPEASAYPMIVFDRRVAFVEPQTFNGRKYFSAEARVEADCEAHRTRVAGLLWRVDLQGRGDGAVDTSPQGGWQTEDSGTPAAAELASACDTVRKTAPPALSVAAPDDRSPEGISRWVSDNRLGLPGWTRISGDTQMAVFLRAGRDEASGSGPISFWAKTEFFEPITLGGRTFRSVLEVQEADCAARKLRNLTAVFYPQSGLTGGGAGGGWQVGEWSSPSAKSHRGAMLQGVCAGVGR